MKTKKGKKVVTRSEVIADYKRVKAKLGRVPTLTEVVSQGIGRPRLYVEYFGGYKKFLKGRKEVTHRETLSKEKYIKDYWRIKKIVGRMPSAREFDRYGNLSSVVYQYGSWSNFVRSLGEEVRNTGNARPIDLVIARRAYKEFTKKHKRDPNSVEFERLTGIRYDGICYRYKNWKNFLKILRKKA